MMRRRWIVAIALSLAIHAGVVMALTPAEDPPDEEAGSGAGSMVIGSIDAIVGIDMPVETLSEPTEMAAVDPVMQTEMPMAETPREIEPTEMAALQPVTQTETPTVETPREIDTTEVAALQPAEVAPAAPAVTEPSALSAAAPQELTPQDALQELAAAPRTEQAAVPSESEVAAVTPLEETTAAAIDADLAAAPALVPESEPVAAAPASTAVEAPAITSASTAVEASASTAVEAPAVAAAEPLAAEVAAVEAVQPVETPHEVAAVTSAAPLHAIAPVKEAVPEVVEQPDPAPKRERRVAKPKTAAPIQRKADKPVTPPRGTGELADRKGGEIADGDSQARDPGRGRSDQAGRGKALNASYIARVAAKLHRARRSIDKDARGTAQVAFVIGSSGAISGLRLVASSGDGRVDDAALATVQRAAPFPPPPKSPFPIRVPIGVGSR